MWVFGPYGVGLLPVADVLLARPLGPLEYGWPLEGILTGPIFAADLASRSDIAAIAALGQEITGNVVQPRGTSSYGDINLGWSVQFASMSFLQSWAFVAIHAVHLVVTAALWWSLATVLRQARTESVFTLTNARRLTIAGAVVAAGSVGLFVATWGLYRWVIATSQIADRVVPPPFGLAWIPLSAIAAAFALMVLGRVWRRGVIMQKELAGLV